LIKGPPVEAGGGNGGGGDVPATDAAATEEEGTEEEEEEEEEDGGGGGNAVLAPLAPLLMLTGAGDGCCGAGAAGVLPPADDGMGSSPLSRYVGSSPAAVIFACTTNGGKPTFSILKKGS
jgi:hypothetical protein